MRISTGKAGLLTSTGCTGLQTSTGYTGLLQFMGSTNLRSRGKKLIDALITGLGEVEEIVGLIGKLLL